MTPYEEVLHLTRYGEWPNGIAPEWAKKEAKRLQTSTAGIQIEVYAYKQEIHRLQQLLLEEQAKVKKLQRSGEGG